jgi:hypothetical protein
MTDVARPCLLDCYQVALVDVVMIVNRGGVVYDRRTKKDD